MDKHSYCSSQFHFFVVVTNMCNVHLIIIVDPTTSSPNDYEPVLVMVSPRRRFTIIREAPWK